MTNIYPTSLLLQDLEVLLVGGGRVAERRIGDLITAGALVTLVSPTLTPELRRLHVQGAFRWKTREYQPADLDRCWLVHIATNDAETNSRIARTAHARRIFYFKGGDPAGATAWRPAVTHVDDVTVAINANCNPRGAVGYRDHLRELLISNPVPQEIE